MHARHIALTLGVTLAGCGQIVTTDGSSGTDYQEETAGRRGIDYAWGRPGVSALKSGGYSFAARYLSYDTTGKNLTRGEADDLRNHGIDVVAVWESGGMDVLDGFGKGADEARAAEAQALACGMPGDRPIYFAIDFDASSIEASVIDAYYDGVASVIGRHRTGAYGGYWQLRRLFDAGKIKYGWQTYAWSGGAWEPRAQLRQVLNGISVGGVDSDRDIAVGADFGQWGYKDATPPPPDDESRITVAANHDGRLEVFYAGLHDDAPGGAIEHEWEQHQGGWSNLDPLGGRARTLVATRNADGRLELFYVGTDHRIYHDFQTTPGGAWYGSVGLGGEAKQLAVAHLPDGRIELIYVGTNGALYHDWQLTNGHWAGQHALGGQARQVAAAENADGRIEIVYVGTNGELYHNWQKTPSGAWEGESHFGGKARRVAIGTNIDGRLEVFYTGTDGTLYHDWQKGPSGAGGWSGAHVLGGKAKDLTVAQDYDGHLELFYIGTDERLYHDWQGSPGAPFVGQRALGGKAKHLTVGQNKDGRLEVFYVGTDEKLYHDWQTKADGQWSGEAPF